jgi:chemotaxis family two-component system response regulator Rcp1
VSTFSERVCLADILLIDDNLGDAKLIELAFRRIQLPTQVTVAETAEQGLDLLQGRDPTNQYRLPDLILLDLNLPTMHGLTFLELVKSDPTLALIPVLVLSSSSAQKDVANSYKRHANGFVTKPSNLEGYRSFADSISDYWFNVVRTPWGSRKQSPYLKNAD